MFSFLKRTEISLTLVVILGLLLRLINLNQSLWLDESVEVLAVKNNSFLNLVTRYSLGDFHPPLYHLVLKAWTNIFGYSEIASRFPSIIFGLATVYFVYLIGKKFFNQKVGLIAALFLAVNPLAVYYSQEARMYSLAMFAVTAAFYFFLNKKYLWYGVFLLVALYTDYLPWLVLPVFFLIAQNKQKFIIFHLSFIIFLLPWLPYLWQQLSIGSSAAANAPLWGQVVGGFSFKSLALLPVKFIFGRISLDNKFLYAIVFGGGAVYYFWLIIKNRSKFLWFWFLVPIILGFIISLKIPVFSYFRFLFVLPAFVLLLAGKAGKFSIVLVTLISLISLIVFNLNPKFQRENWRDAVAYFHQKPGVVLMPSLAQAAPITYYNPTQLVYDKDKYKLDLVKNIYLLRYVQEIFDPDDSLPKALDIAGYVRRQERDFNGVVVDRYEQR